MKKRGLRKSNADNSENADGKTPVLLFLGVFVSLRFPWFFFGGGVFFAHFIFSGKGKVLVFFWV